MISLLTIAVVLICSVLVILFVAYTKYLNAIKRDNHIVNNYIVRFLSKHTEKGVTLQSKLSSLEIHDVKWTFILRDIWCILDVSFPKSINIKEQFETVEDLCKYIQLQRRE